MNKGMVLGGRASLGKTTLFWIEMIFTLLGKNEGNDSMYALHISLLQAVITITNEKKKRN